MLTKRNKIKEACSGGQAEPKAKTKLELQPLAEDIMAEVEGGDATAMTHLFQNMYMGT